MLKKCSLSIIILFICTFVCSSSFAAQEVKGQPESKWTTPLGDDDITNSSDNRCRLIKVLKPGEDKAMETKRNTNQILTRYASELYFEAVKTLFELDEEKPDQPKTVTDEKGILDEEILARMANIADRLNIIASLEARSTILNSVNQIRKMNPSIYSGYEYNEETKKCSLSNGR